MAIVNQTKYCNYFKRSVRETSDEHGGAHMGFSERTDTILQCTNWQTKRMRCFSTVLTEIPGHQLSVMLYPLGKASQNHGNIITAVTYVMNQCQ